MLVSILSLFLAFGLGGGMGLLLLSHRTPPLWLHLLAAVAALGLFLLMAVGLPFQGLLSELPIVLAGSAAFAGAITIYFRLGPAGQKPAPPRTPAARLNLLGLAAMGLVLPMVAGVMSMMTSRLNYAWWLGWSCDGTIVEHTRAHGNHELPTLVVEGPQGRWRFENVDELLWERSRVGQHLTKTAGTPMATLDGDLLRMVPLSVSWWHDPE